MTGQIPAVPGFELGVLRHRRGGLILLDDIDVYYDFDWLSVVGHDRAQFRNGQSLALFAKKHCPAERTPALVLTTRDDVARYIRTTASHFFLVVNLPRYLNEATGNAAESYFAKFESGVALHALASQPDIVGMVLTVDHIAAWVAADPQHREQLRSIVGMTQDHGTDIDIPALLTTLKGLNGLDLDSDTVAALASLFGPGADRDHRLAMLQALTEDSDGRVLTGRVLAERLGDRVTDARAKMAEYQALLDDPETGETTMQGFIEENLWLLGFDYVRMVAQQPVIRGKLDFVLERADGFLDVIELKDPRDRIVVVGEATTGALRPPPSSCALSPNLAQALGQVHLYRDRLTRHSGAHEEEYGLPLSRDPRLIIIIGRADQLSDQGKRVLEELNKSLHRVEVVPYDTLAKRAAATLNSIDAYLVRAESVTPRAARPT